MTDAKGRTIRESGPRSDPVWIQSDSSPPVGLTGRPDLFGNWVPFESSWDPSPPLINSSLDSEAKESV